MPRSSNLTLDSLSGIKSKLKYIVEDESTARNAKIENCIGSVKVPVGIAGPLSIRGPNGLDGIYHAPLATCEPTLVASCARGCKVINASGGVQFKLLRDNMTRAPVFWFSSTEDAASFYDLVPDLFSEFQQIAQSTSNYARLMKLEPQIVGNTVHVLFEYHCGNAAGQNMVTLATQKVCDEFATSNTALVMKIKNITVEGQRVSDKNLSWGNILNSRGVSVIAWATITKKDCQSVLGCSTWDLYEVVRNSKEAATRNGQLGYSIDQANIVTAMFIACGQDAASVAESAWSHLTVEFDPQTKGLSVSTYLPSLPVGTVGAGTILDTQREALELLGCTGSGSKGRLAGLIASFALALDMSTVAAITNNTFAASHRKFARSSGESSKL
ncbi:hydroxymethylglutaryl-coenzyme A reductase family protein [Penicillium macrosclerotiorum]|uniref:hydroxymethylglutaryl-coenzyme A reductase family protein n=1 Tax=Penicillium macrosclerotiorum TaxID=303699 RepID=UPI0025469414|nr:hydroxymethylglutaryl-coenzyme A reductase family protein [Penicillium macrosclerotiorum]KAJ5682421.1 hydroxymethylglutaryl-coenzyme A reductase family protein [Penicillium macrosclerotiorum]